MKINSEQEIRNLRLAPLFRSLKPMELGVIALAMENLIFEAGELILQEGDEGEEAYIIYSGEVEVFKTLGPDQTLTLGRLGQGEFFGELALFGDGTRSASVQAIQETLVGMITKEKLYQIIREFPDIAIEMLKVQTRRFHEAEKRLLEVAQNRK